MTATTARTTQSSRYVIDALDAVETAQAAVHSLEAARRRVQQARTTTQSLADQVSAELTDAQDVYFASDDDELLWARVKKIEAVLDRLTLTIERLDAAA